MRVLATGVSGFVGGHVARRLLMLGHEVVGVVRDAATPVPEGVEAVVRDLRFAVDTPHLPAADAVVHLAEPFSAYPQHASELFRVGAASTNELLEYARRTGASRFVYASTGAVYGYGPRPFTEDDPVVPHTFYALTNIASERLVEAYAGDLDTAASLRLFFAYGPGSRAARLVARLAAAIRAGEPVRLDSGGRPRINPVYVEDVTAAILVALERRGLLTLNVAGDDVVDIRQLATAIGGAVGRPPAFVAGEDDPGGDLVGDNSRLRRLFGRPLTPLTEGLGRTFRQS